MSNENQNQEIGGKYTFWQLLHKYRIEIPIIQRDYAQGRISDNATAIREELLNCMYKALITEEGIDFDFVYGTVEKDVLYPLDGQQRLTTFFLLHWYLAEKEEKMEEAVPILKKFSYTTRPSSREFCEMLMKIKYSPKKEEKVSDFIKNENGYFRSWDTDPTISHMLVMLDAIHQKFFDTEELFGLMIEEGDDELLTFSYLPMEHYALTDDLYIKMNARGKVLTVFENFKAKFIQHLKDMSLPFKQFEDNIDGNWTDLMWDYRAKKDNTIDNKFMNLFCYITEMLYLETEKPSNGDSPFRPSKIRNLIDYYQKEETVLELFKYLDLWKSRKEAESYLNTILSVKSEEGKVRLFEGNPEIFSSIINGYAVPLANKLVLFSIMKRLVTLGKGTEHTAMIDYVRIIRNYLLNTRSFIRNKCSYSPDLRYGRNAIPIMQNFINKLVAADDPYDAIRDIEFVNVNSEICRQEADKAKLILDRPELKSVIHRLEDMELFKGTLFNILPYIQKYDYKKLISKLEVLFTRENGPKIVQGLLSVGDYGIFIGRSIYGDRYFYGCLNDWYSILTYNGDDNYTKIICDFINQFEEAKADYVQGALKELIDNNLQGIDKSDWRYTIVKYESTVSVNNGYVDKPYIIFAMEIYDDSSRVLHRPNGVILNGYHVVPEYLEIEQQLDDHCGYVERGFAGEFDACIALTCVENLFIFFDFSEKLFVHYECDDRDNEWVGGVFDEYNAIDTSDKDIVEKAVIFANMLNEKGKECGVGNKSVK